MIEFFEFTQALPRVLNPDVSASSTASACIPAKILGLNEPNVRSGRQFSGEFLGATPWHHWSLVSWMRPPVHTKKSPNCAHDFHEIGTL
jgi:hypothetical protein